MKVKLPYKPRGEMFATVTDITGGSRMKAFCEDDKHRMVRIPGRLKKKMWCRVNDIIIVKKWAVQSDEKSDVCAPIVHTMFLEGGCGIVCAGFRRL